MKNFLLIFLLLVSVADTFSQALDTSADRVWTPLQVDMDRIGTLKPRSTAEKSSLSIQQ